MELQMVDFGYGMVWLEHMDESLYQRFFNSSKELQINPNGQSAERLQ